MSSGLIFCKIYDIIFIEMEENKWNGNNFGTLTKFGFLQQAL